MVRKLALMTLVHTGGLLSFACDGAEPSKEASGGFEAEVSGTVAGRVSGPGIVQYVPPSEANFGSVPGYFFVADDTGVRDLGITFTIPANTQAGTYQLVSAHPMDVGREFEVRVDHSEGDRTESFGADTRGTIQLESFPKDGEVLQGHPIKGSFDFVTQDRDGRDVTVSGSFDFRAGERGGDTQE